MKNLVDTRFFALRALCRETAQSSADPSPFSPLRKRLRLPLLRAAWSERVKMLGYRTDIGDLLYSSGYFVFHGQHKGLPVVIDGICC